MPDNNAGQTPPQTENEFWDKYGRDAITGSVTKIEESGAKIQSGVTWLWTIYTASAVIGTSIFKPSFPWYINLIIALPIFILMLAYYFSVRIQVPIVSDFDQAMPLDIKLDHLRIMDKKRSEKNLALGSLVVASIFVFSGITLAACYQPQKDLSLSVSQVVSNNITLIAVTGHVPANKQITIKIESLKEPNNPAIKSLVTDNSSKNGDINLSIPVNEVISTYNVVAEWEGTGGLTNSIKKTIKQ